MIVGHHGTHHDALPQHPGLCLAVGGRDDGYRAASAYARLHDGEYVFEVALDDADLVIEDIEIDVRACVRSGEWPCDSAREIAAAVARGVDAIRYVDADHVGAQHSTIRLLSQRALEAVTVTSTFEPT